MSVRSNLETNIYIFISFLHMFLVNMTFSFCFVFYLEGDQTLNEDASAAVLQVKSS